MMDRFALVVVGSLLIAIGIAWAVGAVRLLAGLIAVPILWAMITVAMLTAWVGMHF
jgi:hypothetical protein